MGYLLTGFQPFGLVAGRWRRETTGTLAWIAGRLRMGAPGYVNHLLYRRRKAEAE